MNSGSLLVILVAVTNINIMAITEKQVLDALRNVDDPDLHKDLVTLNMIKDIVINDKEISFSVVLTTPACPMKDMIQKACENAIVYYVDKEAEKIWNDTHGCEDCGIVSELHEGLHAINFQCKTCEGEGIII